MAENTKVNLGDEVERLSSENQELSLVVQEMAAQIHALTLSQLQSVGIDPRISARQALGHTLVQFTSNYNRMPQPSANKDGENLHEGYVVGTMEVVKLRTDEFERIAADFPGMLETNKKKFKERPRFRTSPDRDKNGNFGWRVTPDPVPVDELIKTAREIG